MLFIYLTLLNIVLFIFHGLFIRKQIIENKNIKNILNEQIKALGIIGISRGNSRRL